MSQPDIHQLEERVFSLIGEFRRLKEENKRLSREVDRLSEEREVLIVEGDLNQGNQERLAQLETLSQQNDKYRKTMRDKVQTLLNNLEKFDLA